MKWSMLHSTDQSSSWLFNRKLHPPTLRVAAAFGVRLPERDYFFLELEMSH
jgi:hypothetical protein